MKLKYYILTISTLMLAASCEKYTDITPKGVSMLENTTELEMLLNCEYYGDESSDTKNLVQGCIYAYSNIPNTINQAQLSRSAIIFSRDETKMDRYAELTPSDNEYNAWFNYVGKIANPIIQKVDESNGEERLKKQIKAEAYCMRAWAEFLAVNKFAKGYNPSTADKDGGVAYLKEDWDILQPTLKETVADVYKMCLEDVDAAINLGSLPAIPVNKCRWGLGAAYALKAYLCANMQQWDEVINAADQALAVNKKQADYYSQEYTKITTGYFAGGTYPCVNRPRITCCEDYFTSDGYVMGLVTNEFAASIEPGNYVTNRVTSVEMMYDYYMTGADAFGLGMQGACYVYDFDYGWNFYGFTVSQMYLLKSEAAIHKNNLDEAMRCLDQVRQYRIDPSVYAPKTGAVTNATEAMAALKATARAENVFSYWLFVDQKRWNQVAGWEDTLSTLIGDKTYTLAPNSKMWIFPFPKNVVNANPNMTQNYE